MLCVNCKSVSLSIYNVLHELEVFDKKTLSSFLLSFVKLLLRCCLEFSKESVDAIRVPLLALKQVEAKRKRLGCFFLSESLDEDMDYIFRVPEAYQREGVHDFNHMPPETVLSSDGELSVFRCSWVGYFSVITKCLCFPFFRGGYPVGWVLFQWLTSQS